MHNSSDPSLMHKSSSDIVFGLARGYYLLCGAEYKQQEWATRCGKLKASPKECFWLKTNTVGKHLVPLDVRAVPGHFWDDRGYLSALNDAQVEHLQEDRRSVYTSASAGAQNTVVKLATFKPDDGDQRAGYPKQLLRHKRLVSVAGEYLHPHLTSTTPSFITIWLPVPSPTRRPRYRTNRHQPCNAHIGSRLYCQ
jgi:hypothetical protein